MNIIYDALDFFRRWRGLWLILAAAVLYTAGVCLVCKATITPKAEAQAEEHYNRKLDAYIAEQEQAAQQRADLERAEAESEEAVRRALAEHLAKALYAFRFNSTNDIVTACWCFFNRADIETGEYAYLNTLEDVIEQPGQWMGYNPDNPVLEALYQIAYEQLCLWLDGGHRPCSTEFVFLVWSRSEIYLKDRLEDSKATRTWRYAGA